MGEKKEEEGRKKKRWVSVGGDWWVMIVVTWLDKALGGSYNVKIFTKMPW